MRRGYAVIDDVHPRDAPTATPRAPPRAGPRRDRGRARRGRPPSSPPSIAPRCCASRDQTGGFVEVVPMVGEYLAPGRLGAADHGARAPTRTRRSRGACFVLARQRTIDQDPAFALRMLVDIAIRALSPAVNDPTTAVQALDRIEALLVELAPRHPGPSVVVDDDGAAARDRARAALGRLHRARADGDPPLRRRLAADRAGASTRSTTASTTWPTTASAPRIELERRLLGKRRSRSVPRPGGARDRRAARPARARRRVIAPNRSVPAHVPPRNAVRS